MLISFPLPSRERTKVRVSVINKQQFVKNLRIYQTDAERRLWYHLRNRKLAGIKFRRQRRISSYIVDFVSIENKLVIELDGANHRKESSKNKDRTRTSWLNKEGYRVLRFWNDDVIRHLEKVLARISRSASAPSPRPSPQGAREGDSIQD